MKRKHHPGSAAREPVSKPADAPSNPPDNLAPMPETMDELFAAQLRMRIPMEPDTYLGEEPADQP